MTAFIYAARRFIAGSILTAALAGSGCTVSRPSFLLSEKKPPAAPRPVIIAVQSTSADKFSAANASRLGENSTSIQLTTPELQLVAASDFDTNTSLESLQAIDSDTHVETTSAWSLAAIESIALQQNPALLQASASANKAMGYRNQVGRRPNPIVG